MQSMGRSMDWTLKDDMVDGLFFCATLTGRRPYPICTSRTGNVPHRCGGGWAGPRLFLGESFRVCVYQCLELKCGVLWGWPPTLHSIDDPPTAPHVSCCQKNWWVAVRRVQMGVSIWDAVHLHSMDGWALSGADVQAPWHGFLEIVWLLCDEAQQVGCLRGLRATAATRTESESSRKNCQVISSYWYASSSQMKFNIFLFLLENGTQSTIKMAPNELKMMPNVVLATLNPGYLDLIILWNQFPFYFSLSLSVISRSLAQP